MDEKTVKKIAKLARIELKEEEVGGYVSELTNIMALAEQLQEVNTDGVPEMAGVGHNILRSREDKITDGQIREDVLKNAPKSEFGCFVVPKVVE